MSEYKRFSKKLYQENDQIAKEIVLDYLISTGYYKLETPLNKQKELYKKQDFEVVLISKGKKVPVEVERKKVWTKSFEWQGWSTIDVPVRKSESKAKLYVMVNEPCDTIAVTKMKKVLNSKISSKRTIYTDNEDFYNVELSEFKFYRRKNGTWENF
jgi:hypothetical protein